MARTRAPITKPSWTAADRSPMRHAPSWASRDSSGRIADETNQSDMPPISARTSRPRLRERPGTERSRVMERPVRRRFSSGNLVTGAQRPVEIGIEIVDILDAGR